MTIPEELQLNEYGFYEVKSKPSAAELSNYYARRYYQENHATYQASYSPAELTQIEGKLRLRHFVLTQSQINQASSSVPHQPAFLDIGCGEGWALAFFQQAGWNVLGLDFSSFSVELFHPQLRSQLRTGDLYEELTKLSSESQRFEALWLDNVLEHVLEPAELLHLCRKLIAPGGVLVVEVPNDFSSLQDYLLTAGHIDRPFWVALPDHLSYFNPTGLRNLAEATGWKVARTLADQPIDLNLLNPATNYVMNRSAGPGCHQARLEQDNFLLQTASLSAVASYYESMAGVGLGRNMVAFLQPA